MARRLVLTGISLLLLATTACADRERDAGPDGGTASDDLSTGSGDHAFDVRAQRIAEQWRTAGGERQWRDGFVPLQDLTVPPDGVTWTPATRQAFLAGWYRLTTPMPRETGGRTGQITYPDGAAQTVPLVPLAEAYGEVDKGDPPACREATIPPPPAAGADDPPPPGGAVAPRREEATEPDIRVQPGARVQPGVRVQPAAAPGDPLPTGTVRRQPPKPCLGLTITAVRLGDVELLTSRGPARVPAWLFTVEELGGAVARVAVAPSATRQPPELKIDADALPEVPGLVAAHDLSEADGARLTYRLGVGACDKDLRPVWYESADVVVVGGTAVRSTATCTDQLLLKPVQATLAEPLGARPVLDGTTGQVLTVTAAQPGE